MSHIHGRIDFTVEVFIVCGDKVLLRKHDKYGIWLGAGGHIELDEDPIQAAIRESKEEVGLDIAIAPPAEYEYVKNLDDYGDLKGTELIPPRFLNRHHIIDQHEHIACIYFARTNSNRIVPEKDTDICIWMTKEEVEKHPEIAPRIKYYAITALHELVS